MILTPRDVAKLDPDDLLEQARARGVVIQGDAVDALDALPDRIAQAFITDPPYCSGGFSETGKRASKGMTELAAAGKSEWFPGDNMGTAGLVYLLRAVAVQARRVLLAGGHLLCFCDWRMEPNLVPLDGGPRELYLGAAELAPVLESATLRHQKTLVWDKQRPGMGNGFRASHEQVLHLVKGKGEYFADDGRDVISCASVHHTNRRHPTEKPQPLLRELIRVTTPAGGLVVDPFAGSGSSGVAALAMGRAWIGVELTRKYARETRERLDSVGEVREPAQAGLFS